ncbi:centaurin beta [Nesidiocoris tenuis]|uniref:Centaurin beta n=1 Tax=Nesidiocoris tenuis TaxID=355587 RepID=A0ABN7AVM0_9HEMI|nr:centaurin beta [Nesidiocoris tenuis]
MVTSAILPEALRDSPRFRAQLAREEADIETLENKLDRILKTCGVMVDSGKSYVQHQTLFANALWDLSSCFASDVETMSKFNRIIQAIQEMSKFQTILLDQASRTILTTVTNFVKEDIKGVWESRHLFDKISTELDGAVSRHAQTPKNKPVDIEQATVSLQATSKCFKHTALDHVYAISMIQSKQKLVILGCLLSYMQANVTYFHQGSDLCESLQPFLRKLNSDVLELQSGTKQLEKTLGERHNLVSQLDENPPIGPMQGYLFKRTTNAFKTWHRRWFLLKDNQLVYRKRTGEDSYTVMEEDLRLCTVKPAFDAERRFCFEVLSPNRSHMLQADSEANFARWIAALQQGIGAALQLSSNSSDSRELSAAGGGVNASVNEEDSSNNNRKTKIWEQLARIPGNDICCDCKSPDPRWASINLGITLCIDCSGVHRSLGVHHSKVRSLTLDAWEPEILKVMAELGNQVVNTVYEANIDSTVVIATPSCSGLIRESYIKRKWVNKDFVAPLSISPLRPKRKWSVRKLRRRAKSMEGGPKHRTVIEETRSNSCEDDQTVITEVAVLGDELNNVATSPIDGLNSDDDSTDGDDNATVDEEDISKLSPTRLLHKASKAHNIPVMCHAFALGANKLWTDPEQGNRTHLHQAIISGSVMACEYLLLNGVPINTQDITGNTPLHLATELGHTAQVCLLLKHRADQHIKNEAGVDPLDTAVQLANADIVTLLRLGRLNEEMRNAESGGDETFNDVVRDFSQLSFDTNGKVTRPGSSYGGSRF